jgi:gliding motility-associated lipoprotein GldH
MKSYQFVLSAFLFLLFAACGPKYAINKTYDIPDNQWTYADSLRFEFAVNDTTTLYNLLLEIKHSTDFSTQNLYTQIHTQFPNGMRLSKPVSLELANKIGIWQGDCNSKSCTMKIPIQEGAYFNQAGNYIITIEQFMRDSVINGVQSVTFKVLETRKIK